MIKNLSPDIDFQAGYVLAVNKPYEWTSSDVVRKIKNILIRKPGLRKIKIGHAGTLDPLATGVLLICIGKATKQADSLQAERKEYIAGITLGATTPSYDLEHEVDKNYPYEHITQESVLEALKSFIGTQQQVAPLYSAKWIDGKRAYEYAREGNSDVEIKASEITIYDAELLECDLPRIKVRIECSKGTYIRSFARDLGITLQSGGHLHSLARTKNGDCYIENCYTMDEVSNILKVKRENVE